MWQMTKNITVSISNTGRTEAPQLFVSLQALRGVAALMVVLFHAQFILFDQLPDEPARFGFLSVGDAGVELFFVLSGFILVLAHWGDLNRADRLGRFAWKRFARIYPLYWLVLAGLILGQLAMNRLEPAARSLSGLLEAVTLLPVDGPAILTVAWTLSHELLFYLFLGVMILHLKAGLALMLLWQAGCLITYLIGADLAHYAQFLLAPHNMLFGIGMGVALLYQRATLAQAQGAAWLGVCVFAGSAFGELAAPAVLAKSSHGLLYGIGSALIIAGLARIEMLGRLSIPAPLRFLGDASYSVYLVHSPAMVFFMILAVKLGLGESLPIPVFLLLLVAWGVLVGALCHIICERPLLKASRKWAPAQLRRA